MSRTALMVAYYFPPSASVGAQRTVRWVRYLPELGWRPVLLTVRERDFGDTPLVPRDSRTPARVPVYRARVLRPLQVALRVRGLWRALWRTLSRALPRAMARRSVAPAAPTPAILGSTARRSWTTRWIDPWLTTPDANIGWWPFALVAGLRAIRQQRPHVLYSSGPPHSSHLIAAALKRLTRIPWVADFRDPWTRRPWLAAADRRGLRYRVQVWLEAMVVGHADRVVLNTPAMGDDFRACYPGAAAKFRVISNGYDPDAFSAMPEGMTPAPGIFTLTHAGALYRRRDPRPLLRAIARLRDRGVITPADFKLMLVGSVEAAFGLESFVQELGIGGLVSIVPRVPHAESLGFLARSHVLVLIQPDTDLQVPGKLFEYLYLRKPVLALASEGATADLVRHYDLGVVVDPADVCAVTAALQTAIASFKAGLVRPPRTEEALRVFHGRGLTATLAGVFGEVAVSP